MLAEGASEGQWYRLSRARDDDARHVEETVGQTTNLSTPTTAQKWLEITSGLTLARPDYPDRLLEACEFEVLMRSY